MPPCQGGGCGFESRLPLEGTEDEDTVSRNSNGVSMKGRMNSDRCRGGRRATHSAVEQSMVVLIEDEGSFLDECVGSFTCGCSSMVRAPAFQAGNGGSIPLTRSKLPVWWNGDTLALGASALWRAGSSPVTGTPVRRMWMWWNRLNTEAQQRDSCERITQQRFFKSFRLDDLQVRVLSSTQTSHVIALPIQGDRKENGLAVLVEIGGGMFLT